MGATRAHVGTRKGLFSLVRGAAGWEIDRVSFLAVPVTMFLRDPRDGTLYASTREEHFGPKMHRSRDGGTTWEEIASPQYPPKPPDLEEPLPPVGEPNPWSLKLVWALEPANSGEAGTLWCGTAPGGLFHSSDHGNSWDLVRPLWDMPSRQKWFGGGYNYPAIHSVCVDPRDARCVTVAVSCGGVWHTADGGRTWSPRTAGMEADYVPPEMRELADIQDPHLMVQCAGNPDALWVQHHCGIYRSTNRGARWSRIRDVSPSAFGFAVAAHPRDSETAWFVPAQKDEYRVPVDGQVVVNRTRDGGRTFETLRRGLPQKHAYDLVYRHALAVDASGERLLMGSTTGSLWVSEDQGDSWTAVSHHLPPVYCVRFD